MNPLKGIIFLCLTFPDSLMSGLLGIHQCYLSLLALSDQLPLSQWNNYWYLSIRNLLHETQPKLLPADNYTWLSVWYPLRSSHIYLTFQTSQLVFICPSWLSPCHLVSSRISDIGELSNYVHIPQKLILYIFNWLYPIFCFCCLRHFTHIFFTIYPNIFISRTEMLTPLTPHRPHLQACHIVLFMAVS